MNEQSYNNIKNAIKELENELKILQNIPKKINNIQKEIIVIEKKITELEAKKHLYNGRMYIFNDYKKHLQSSYRNFFNQLNALKTVTTKEIIEKKQNNKKELLKIIELFEKNRNQDIQNKKFIQKLNDVRVIFLDWKNIIFRDGFIEIKINSHYEQIKIEESKQYLETIKFYYSFKNVPKLEIVISGTKIIEIRNIEVLFYHIDFLSIVGHTFETESFEISKLKRYDKTYFLKFLPFAFTKNSLSFLCEICDENFPIIPMPELIIGRNETKVIQDSFLFKCNNKLIWESIEHSKASYVFEFSSFDEDAQRLLDYITNEKITNKRQKLIRSYELKKELMFYNRIYHNNFYEWKIEITSAIEV